MEGDTMYTTKVIYITSFDDKVCIQNRKIYITSFDPCITVKCVHKIGTYILHHLTNNGSSASTFSFLSELLSLLVR